MKRMSPAKGHENEETRCAVIEQLNTKTIRGINKLLIYGTFAAVSRLAREPGWMRSYYSIALLCKTCSARFAFSRCSNHGSATAHLDR